MYKYLTILILSLMLIPCSGGERSKGGEPGGNREPRKGGKKTTGSKGGKPGGSEKPVVSCSFTENKRAMQVHEVSGHWIQSVPFQRIKAGKFTMGSPAGESERLGGSKKDDEEQVKVTITKPFEMMKTEVTQKQWFLVEKDNPSVSRTSEDCDDHEVINKVEMCPNNPVEWVSWNAVQNYIKKLNKSLGLTGCNGTPQDSSGCYRLPTEAEWEWAVRAGKSTAYFFGDDSSNLGNYAWYIKNYRISRTYDLKMKSSDPKGKTHKRGLMPAETCKVGMKSSNPNGLYDVYGNVWEWVQDGYSKKLPGGKDPLYKGGKFRVIRGGSNFLNAWQLRSAHRKSELPRTGANLIGFRLVRTL